MTDSEWVATVTDSEWCGSGHRLDQFAECPLCALEQMKARAARLTEERDLLMRTWDPMGWGRATIADMDRARLLVTRLRRLRD